MLIWINGNSATNMGSDVLKLTLNIPAIYLDDHKYEISLRMMYLETVDYLPERYFSLQTSIIDQNVFNPNQELFSFIPMSGSNYFCVEPVNLRTYKVQVPSLHSSEFYLHVRGEHHPINIKDIVIILEIKRDAGI